jgi:hypothetical protein
MVTWAGLSYRRMHLLRAGRPAPLSLQVRRRGLALPVDVQAFDLPLDIGDELLGGLFEGVEQLGRRVQRDEIDMESGSTGRAIVVFGDRLPGLVGIVEILGRRAQCLNELRHPADDFRSAVVPLGESVMELAARGALPAGPQQVADPVVDAAQRIAELRDCRPDLSGQCVAPARGQSAASGRRSHSQLKP